MKNKIKDRLEEPWAKKQVGHTLGNVLYWVQNGYQFTQEDRTLIEQLHGYLQEPSCSA